MKKYILDTNIASLLGSEENPKNQLIFDKFYELEDDDIVMVSIITLYEAQSGINKKSMKKNDLDILIASTAMATNATLISDDGIFKKLSEIEPKFQYENWLK